MAAITESTLLCEGESVVTRSWNARLTQSILLHPTQLPSLHSRYGTNKNDTTDINASASVQSSLHSLSHCRLSYPGYILELFCNRHRLQHCAPYHDFVILSAQHQLRHVNNLLLSHTIELTCQLRHQVTCHVHIRVWTRDLFLLVPIPLRDGLPVWFHIVLLRVLLMQVVHVLQSPKATRRST